MKEEFKIDSKKLEYLSIDILKLYYESAQKRMEDFHQQANDTTNRAYQLISIYIGVLTLLCGYIYTYWAITKSIMAILAIVTGLAVAICIILKIILPRMYMPIGRSPKELKPNEYARYFSQEKDMSDEIKLKFILKDEIETLQGCIDWQGDKNRGRTHLFTLSLLAACSGILSSAIIALFT